MTTTGRGSATRRAATDPSSSGSTSGAKLAVAYWCRQLAGVTTTTQLFTNPTVKLGLTNNLDFEVNIAPWEQVSTHDAASGATTTSSGVGDLFLRAKLSLLGDDCDGVAEIALRIEPSRDGRH